MLPTGARGRLRALAGRAGRALAVYLALWPLWSLVRLSYDRWICALYMATGPLFEHPFRTLGIDSRAASGGAIVKTVLIAWDPQQSFTLTTRFSYVDVPIFAALVLSMPGPHDRSRWGLLWRGGLLLIPLHLVRLAADLCAARGLAPLPLAALRPGPIALSLSRALLTTVFESDVIFALPFLLWWLLQSGLPVQRRPGKAA